MKLGRYAANWIVVRQLKLDGALPALPHPDRRATGHFAPGAESSTAGSTMFVGGQAVATELDVFVDPVVGGEEALRGPRQLGGLGRSVAAWAA